MYLFVFFCFSLQFIYQFFYKHSSGADQGTLSQLRNVLRRVDVSGADAVTHRFRYKKTYVKLFNVI